MFNYLEFKEAKCKDCYRCLKYCPVKAIEFIDHHAQIIPNRCILCGTCTLQCPQNAKRVHSEVDQIKEILKSNDRVIASIAPSFVSSFGLQDFAIMEDALKKLGFYFVEETAVGAKAVTAEYDKLIRSGDYPILISSACPAINRMIRLYHHDALKYLAPVVSPMVAHAKILRARFEEDIKIIFIGPCIAKKREGHEAKNIDGVLTFEELNNLFKENNIDFGNCISKRAAASNKNIAKFYPIARGVIKSFNEKVEGVEYVAVDGATKCKDVLNNINNLHMNAFLEFNSCEYACVNGPCSMISQSDAVMADSKVRAYTKQDIINNGLKEVIIPSDIDLSCVHTPLNPYEKTPTEEEIEAVLRKTGKYCKEDELNCGACGYETCREKAWAVINGLADIEMCVPFMRTRAESLSYEIIKNMPSGIIVCDNELKITEINKKAAKIIDLSEKEAKTKYVFDCIDPTYFIKATEKKTSTYRKKIFIDKTKKYIELTVIVLKDQDSIFGILRDITEETQSEEKLNKMKLETLKTTDEVIQKQMRVAQEIASVLGETVAETKVAIVNLRKSLTEEKDK